VLADLYFAQGHYAEALAIYDDLVASHPQDEDVRRLRRDAEARLLPAAATTAAAAEPHRTLERRLAKIRTLKRWLSVVQTG
jgi:cytochrome c-type biogenesis protein CcmH/NrfG